jgi:two-component system sensor histidine kinase DesK
VVTLSRNRVEIADDGCGPVAQPPENKPTTGLQGLRERVERTGGTLTVGRSDLGGFLLRVTVSGRLR